jgi:hypothetical protein
LSEIIDTVHTLRGGTKTTGSKGTGDTWSKTGKGKR